MKIHDKNCENCVSTVGEKECFSDFKEMMRYHKSQRNKVIALWEDYIYYPIYRCIVWKVWDKIRPGKIKHYYQRAKNGYSYQDCWSIDWYIADVLPKMIRTLKKNHHGHPQGLSEKEWDKILEDIAYGFDLQHEVLEHKLYDLANAKNKKIVQDMFDADSELYEECRIITKGEKVAIKRSWKLFQKYFYNLWD